MIKRRKDGGFTLIELMIVIAVIGILAIVLVPKMSNAKDAAKEAGVITNAKSVETFVVANFDKWSLEGKDTADITEFIEKKFEEDGAIDKLVNPINAQGTAISIANDKTIDSNNVEPGQITVEVIDDENDLIDITIKGYGVATGEEIYYSKITPSGIVKGPEE